ncbi:MAG TPA: GNAT family N-acetyltransferase [Pyrinomonadaceae bacterium]|jgi:ribosomal protein S18 acetylase RimI-like enzyme
MAQGQRPAPQSRAGTPQRFENRALAATSQAGKNQQPMRSSSARGPDYMVHPPTQLGGRLQQIKVTVKGTQQLAGSVNIYPTSGGQLFISNLKVERAYRKRGIASQLMNAALTAGRNQGFSGARLEARPFDTGISSHALVSMYRKMGFKSVGKSGSGSPMMERNL